jgi:solute carrier family 8 (sodium/calcium exchanger)
VYAVTCVFSVWAYVWFYLVLVIFSPNRVELWEALTTFGFMCILVVLAYGADRYKASGDD